MGILSVLSKWLHCINKHVISIGMIETAEAYWELGAQAPYESIIEKTKDTLETAKETKCYIYAKCKLYIIYFCHICVFWI
jgi:hypothetical protein